MIKNPILLNPGPVNLSGRVRKALIRPDMCHREPDFSRIQEDIRKRLLGVYGLSPKRFTSIVMTGSGTAAVEAMISSFIPEGGKLLILSNGVYGERMVRMAKAHRIAYRVLSFVWGEEIPAVRVVAALKSDTRITHVAVVHHETTTGRLNDLQAIGKVCKKFKKVFLVDGVSSFGAEDIKFEQWGVSGCAGSSNKCLHGVAGIAFVVCRRELFAKARPAPRRSCYLDLDWYYQEQERGSSPFTHAVQAFFAFEEALKEYFAAGGWQARHDTYEQRARLIREEAKKIGLCLYLNKGLFSCILTAFYLPKEMTYEKLHNYLRSKGFIIYAGQGAIAKIIFRVANMGTVSKADIRRFFKHLKGILCKR